MIKPLKVDFKITPEVHFPVTVAVASKASCLSLERSNLAIVSKANKSGADGTQRKGVK